MASSLFIGRFQPFHLGHLDVFKQILKKEEHLIIGIGSAENSREKKNPFTASERYQMIDSALKEEKIPPEKYTIIPVRNIDNYDLWTKHVESLVPPFKTVYTGSSIVKKLFLKDGRFKIKDIKFNIKICATEIRKKMIEGENWGKFVPKAVAKLIKKWHGDERLKNL